MKHGIQKAPEAVSDRKTDPEGVQRFEARRLGIVFGNLRGAFFYPQNMTSEKGIPKNDPTIDAYFFF